MSKFFKKAFKDISTMAEKASIPVLKGERDALETERNEVLAEIEKTKANELVLRPLLESMERTKRTNLDTMASFQTYFQTQNFIPLADKEQATALENEMLRELNVLYVTLVEANRTLDETIAKYSAVTVPAMEDRVAELNVEIQKYNVRLSEIRAK